MKLPVQGNSLGEYGLAGGLVILLGLGSLTLLGTEIQTLFQGQLSQGLSDAAGYLSGKAPSGSPGRTGTAASPSSSGPAPGAYPAADVTYTTESGKTITIPAYPTDTAKAVEVMGANGATEVLASTLQNLAAQLLANGEISKEDYASLMVLANKGHKLGETLGIISSVMTPDKNLTTASGTMVQFNGGEYNLTAPLIALASGFPYRSGITDPLAPGIDSRAYSGDLLTFYNTYQSLEQKGALADPRTRAVVHELGSEIISVTLGFGNVYNDFYKVHSSNPNALIPADMHTGQIAEQLVHRNSAGICSAGGGSDSGIHCSN